MIYLFILALVSLIAALIALTVTISQRSAARGEAAAATLLLKNEQVARAAAESVVAARDAEIAGLHADLKRGAEVTEQVQRDNAALRIALKAKETTAERSDRLGAS